MDDPHAEPGVAHGLLRWPLRFTFRGRFDWPVKFENMAEVALDVQCCTQVEARNFDVDNVKGYVG